MSDWQPIETAPKNGRPILGWAHYWPDGNKVARAVVIWWQKSEGEHWETQVIDENTFLKRRIVSDKSCWVSEDTRDTPVKPTHWMPLPEPPGAIP